MSPQNEFKFRFLFRRYLVVYLCVIATTAFISWLFIGVLYTQVFEEFTLILIFAIGLPSIGTFIFLSPWYTEVYIDTNRIKRSALVTAGSTVTMVVPAILFSYCLLAMTGKLLDVHNISEIAKHPIAKYYVSAHLYADTGAKSFTIKAEIKNYKAGSKLKLTHQLIIPLFDKANDTVSVVCTSWIGYSYDTEVATGMNWNDEKIIRMRLHAEGMEVYNENDLTKLTYLVREGNTDNYRNYQASIKSNKRYSESQNIILTPAFDAFSEHYIGDVVLSILATILCAIAGLICIVTFKVDLNDLPANFLISRKQPVKT